MLKHSRRAANVGTAGNGARRIRAALTVRNRRAYSPRKGANERGNTMNKMSHRALKEMGKALDGMYFDGNIYAHGNRVHYLSSLPYAWDKESMIADAKRLSGEMGTLIDEIAALDCDCTRTEQLAYSCGIYGNSGQLHRIEYFKNDESVKVLFLYC